MGTFKAAAVWCDINSHKCQVPAVCTRSGCLSCSFKQTQIVSLQDHPTAFTLLFNSLTYIFLHVDLDCSAKNRINKLQKELKASTLRCRGENQLFWCRNQRPLWVRDISQTQYEPCGAPRSAGSGLLVVPRVKTEHGEAAFSFYAAQRVKADYFQIQDKDQPAYCCFLFIFL